MWMYEQTSGRLSRDNKYYAIGYSGHEEGMNNPDMQNVSRIGPIPQGTYTIGKAYHHEHLGDCVMNLDAQSGTNTFGRSLFRLHGDNSKVNHSASEGCIILPANIRKIIDGSPDKVLHVTN